MSPLPSNPNRISARNIKDEFGQNGSTWNISDYRRSINRGGVNWPVDDGIPTSGTIKFSDFHSKQHNIVILMDGGTGYRQTILGNKSSIDSTAYRGTSSGVRRTSKNIVYIIKKIGSTKSDKRNTCALRTGNKNNWYGGNPNGGKVLIRLGSGGKLYGAGGDGGRGGRHEVDGADGGNGNSALGLEVNVESVTVDSGGLIVAGSGGGGGGGGARETSRKYRRAGGGGGGGGAGLPNGNRGRGRDGNRRGEADGEDGNDGTLNNGGDGGKGSDNDEEATGGGGGGGGAVNGTVGEAGPKREESGGNAGEAGKTSGEGGKGGDGRPTGGEGRKSSEGGNGGEAGYAITRGSGISQPSLSGQSRIKGTKNTQSGVR